MIFIYVVSTKLVDIDFSSLFPSYEKRQYAASNWFFYLAGVSIENGWDGYTALVLQKNKHGENYMILLNYHMQN